MKQGKIHATEGQQSAYDLQVVQSLRQIIRAIDVHSRKMKTQYNVTGPQLICLGIIKESGTSTVTKIAKQAYLSNSTVVGILDRLQHEGYILRERDVSDRRNWNVALTDRARKLLEAVPPLLHDRLRFALRNLPEAEQADIARSVLRIVELMGAQGVDAAPILETANIRSEAK